MASGAGALQRGPGDGQRREPLRGWQTLSGNFHAKNLHRGLGYYEIVERDDCLFRAIREQRKRILCINDRAVTEDVGQISAGLQAAFQEILPDPSAF